MAVVGAGAAGLTAGIAAAEVGAAVIIYEQLPRPGSKLLASGGGRCNLSNTLPTEEFMSRFGRQGRFMAPALAAMDSEGLRGFFRALGVETVCEGQGLVFPQSNSASAVLSALVRRCGQLGVELRRSCRIEALRVENGRVAGVQVGQDVIATDAVVIAAGGFTYPKLGGSAHGYELATQTGHEIVQPTPALVPLVTKETWPACCSGVSLPNVRVWIDLPRQQRCGATGQVLLTHRGISGPAVLDISGDVARLLATRPEVPLALDISAGLPLASKQGWLAEMDKWRRHLGDKRLRRLLGPYLPLSVVDELLQLAGVPREAIAAELPAAGREKLVGLLTKLPLTVTATEGLDRAMVARGGVGLKHVDPASLASKLVAGLYFAGEVLDLDGPCGGFNLQWAFSSGRLAGQSAAASPLFLDGRG